MWARRAPRSARRRSALLAVLENRLDQVGWQHRVFASAVPPETLVSMQLDALPRCAVDHEYLA
jgi:hypothetical protein